jgi:hypothetical protein
MIDPALVTLFANAPWIILGILAYLLLVIR